ncbi:MAG: DUF167 domain-containing protein [Candidatus Binatia bacterium]
MPVRISVLVKAQARKECLTKISEKEYRISVHAPPVAGKANEAVVRILAHHFSVAKSSVKVLRGQSARKKLIEIG